MLKGEVTQSCLTLCDPVDCNLLGFSVHGISRQEYWSGLPFPSPGDLPDPGIEPRFPALQADTLTSESPGKALANKQQQFIRYTRHSAQDSPYVYEPLFPWWLCDKGICLQRRSRRSCGFDPWVRKISWRKKWLPTPVFLLREFHGQRSLMGFSPWGSKQSDKTQRLNNHKRQGYLRARFI